MAGRIYALLVGIDAYRAPVAALRGCVNDVRAVAEVLEAAVEPERLDVVRVEDEEASRANVVTRFREHLSQAGPEDVALFYFSGHGSQEVVERTGPVETDRLNETLVLHDSRQPGQRDLADKELGALVAEVAERSPHIVVVLDCCHSGSGTRVGLDGGARARRTPTDRRPRTADSYLGAVPGAANDGDAPVPRSARPASGWMLPRADHVLLAACRADQTAKELTIDGRTRGVFSAALESALRASRGTATYRDLHRWTATAARNRVREQDPQLELTRAADQDRPFLGGALRAGTGAYVLTHLTGAGWVIDAGSVHGIPVPVGTETTHLAVFAPDANLAAPRVADAIASATVSRVEPGWSRVAVIPADALDTARSYRAIVTAIPLLPLRVTVTGAPERVDALRARLGDPDDAELLALLKITRKDDAEIHVYAGESGFDVGRPAAQRALASWVAGNGNDAVERAVAVLEHVARWSRLRTLHNAATTLPPDAVRVELHAKGAVPAAGRLRIAYSDGPDGLVPPRFSLTLTNTTNRTLWCSIIDFTEPYGVFVDALPAGSVQLAASAQETVELSGDISEELWREGITELDDVLKVIVSTTEFDPRPLAMEELDVAAPAPRLVLRRPHAPMSTLDRLLRRVSTRRVRPRPEDSESITDWFALDVLVTTLRPAASQVVPRPGEPDVTIAAGVTMSAHPSLRASLTTTHGAEAHRDISAPPLPAVLRDAAEAVEPFALVATHDGTEILDALVLTGVSGADGVTEEQPLRLRVEQPLGADEHVLPLAWDGEFYLALGRAQSDGATTEILLERLPDVVTTDRDLFGSIKVLLRKVVGRRNGLPYTHPLLRLAVAEASGALTYVDDPGIVRAAVREVPAVLLYVHGIIGDTEGMASSSASTNVRPAPQLVGSCYGAVLTFDYENLSTSIRENARLLRARLEDIGLGAGHGKRLDVVAHSMGGLVSRYFIECEGGDEVVSRLVTLGTPNGGSPWPTVQKWGAVAVTAALNGLTAVAWPAQVLTAVLGAIERTDVALDEMEPSSDLLAALRAAPDPGVPYTVVIGNRSFIVRPDDGGVLSRLLAKLSPRRLAGDVADLAFLGRPNDLAVAVSSARDLPERREPAPRLVEIACDHVSFFGTAAGLAAVAEALIDGVGP